MTDLVQLGACLTERRLQLILLPTEACNFRCTYCYEDFRLAKMKPEVVRGVKRLLTRRFGRLEQVHISWFGGEPLLARGVIEDVMTHVRDLRRGNPGVRVSSDMTTNAYRLDEASFARLLDLGVTAYQVTFDGPREWHDRRRVTAAGRGTFDVIWGRLLAASRVPGRFAIQLRVHVDADNHVAVPRFLGQYRESFGADSRFSLFIRRLERLGGPDDASLRVLDDRQAEAILGDLTRRAREHGLETAGEGDHPAVCYAARANSFVVRADGRLNKCTVALSHPCNDVGVLTEDGRIELYPGKSQPWMRGLLSGDREELECPMLGLVDRNTPASSPSTERAIARARRQRGLTDLR